MLAYLAPHPAIYLILQYVPSAEHFIPLSGGPRSHTPTVFLLDFPFYSQQEIGVWFYLWLRARLSGHQVVYLPSSS